MAGLASLAPALVVLLCILAVLWALRTLTRPARERFAAARRLRSARRERAPGAVGAPPDLSAEVEAFLADRCR
ncbi:MAG TPA: hypothetical protein VFM09_07070 [Marmoricola sp.]|nr:hypothetical protein [Marmoricola sp.]